ncbi:cobalt/nickel transport system permease protein [Virgibacillus natechei]|uniref:Cobalt/nickel transport system permease protein n=1 Tax=Virgibacillus natechei TaxID=1216297 RepID=A0ABS4IEV6_9BACI|nr:CbiM family transporter [Virgibacillus natechei]MBP1969467.1 cobalt/nickel transport system permease protein [Virgibacillus natechei]UZD11827.1 CbiM family transporter [Virgibacillus natechei]
MHIADGVLSFSVAITTTVGAVGILAYSLKGTKEEEIPKISLLSGAFFVASLINIPIGPTSVHPLLGGFLGLVLGRRAPFAIFIGLILQAILFQHGGISTFGANTLLMSIPALCIYWLTIFLNKFHLFWRGFIAGFSAILIGVGLLIILLLFSDQRYGEGSFSVIRIVVLAYFPLALLEGVLTGFSVKHLHTLMPRFFGITPTINGGDNKEHE